MDGIIILKKEKEWTSHDVVAKIKSICKTKVGHTGTLDPMATGVLPLLLGEGTKLSKYLIEHDKIYDVILQLGIKTETADGEGQIIEEKEVNSSLLTLDYVTKILQTLLGKQKQKPPIYSAIKIKGKKLYEYARNNEQVEIPEREIEIYDINLKQIDLEENTIYFDVHCSKGTYIRSLCEVIAEKLNTVGYMKELNRVQVGKFRIDEAYTISEVEKFQKQGILEEKIITIEKFAGEKSEIKLSKEKLQLFLNGVLLTYEQPDGICRIYNFENQFIGLGIIENNKLKRDIIL